MPDRVPHAAVLKGKKERERERNAKKRFFLSTKEGGQGELVR